MIKIKIKTIWQGKVGIRDKYIQQAKKEKQDLFFSKGNDYMIIPVNEVDDKIVAKSEHPVFDKFGGEYHYLIYFNWSPTTNQKSLFD